MRRLGRKALRKQREEFKEVGGTLAGPVPVRALAMGALPGGDEVVELLLRYAH